MLAAILSLTACAQLGFGQPEDAAVAVPSRATTPPEAAEIAVAGANPSLTAAPRPPAAAKTQEALDTTTAAQRAEAAAPAAASEAKLLGTTVASLGSPTEPGFWLKTPLVKTQAAGRVTNPKNGKSSAVTLIPIDGPVTAGSRMSLPAMRLIEASLTELTEVEVTLGG